MAETRRSGRPAFGVRSWTTAIAVAVVALVLSVVAIAVVAFIDRTLTDQVRDAAAVRLEELTSSLPGSVPIPAASEEEFVQVVSQGGVISSTENLRGRALVAELVAGEETVVVDVVAEEGPFLVMAADADAGTVLVGRSLDDAAEVSTAAASSFAIAVPVLVAIVGVLTWLLVGRALSPVDEMRAEADRISASELHRRLPDLGARDEVGRLARTLNGMLGRLEDANLRQRRFVSDASHELRSPIASIRQHAELAHTDDDPVVRELGTTVLTEVTRLQRLVDDLLLLASLDEGARTVAEEVDLDDLVLSEAERLRTDTAIRVDTAGVGPGRVEGNPAQLTRLLRNLAENAARHARGTVALGVVTTGGHVVVTIDDDGSGIPSDERVRALERFVRLDEGRGRNDGGSGLGLAIVRDVSVAHGGRVELGASELGGLRAAVILPARR